MNWIFDRLAGARVSDRLTSPYGRVLVLENEALQVVCLPEKGGDIFSFFFKHAGCECLIHPFTILPGRGPSMPVGGATIEHVNETVWPEMFPIASDYADYFGLTQPLHGEARMLAWRYDILEDAPERVAVRLRVRTRLSPFVLTRTMILEAAAPVLVMEESVENQSPRDLPIIWGHHPTFGEPFLSEHCRIYLPPGELVGATEKDLAIRPPDGGKGVMAYLLKFREGWGGIFNHQKQFGFGMRWDPAVFRTCWVWQTYRSIAEAPMFNRMYAVALEPVSSMNQSHPRFKEMPMLVVPAGGRLETRLEAFVFRNPEDLGGR